jgi:hypothetical protein
VNLSVLLSPLHQVTSWLLFNYEITMKAAQDDSFLQELKAGDAAAAAASADAAAGSSDSSSGDRVLASVDKQAKQLQTASQAAAGSLVLTVLLARAAAPLLDWIQTELKELPDAPGGAGGVTLPLTTAVNLWVALQFVNSVWRAICARYALSQLLEEQLTKLFRAAAAATTTSAAVSKQVAGSKGTAADGQAAAAAAEAEKVAEGLKAATNATKAALHGRGLARGWSHLAFLLPQGALLSARDFQSHWPGEAECVCKQQACEHTQLSSQGCMAAVSFIVMIVQKDPHVYIKSLLQGSQTAGL